MASETKLHRLIRWFQDNKVFSWVLFVVVILVGAGTLTGSIDNIVSFAKKYLAGEPKKTAHLFLSVQGMRLSKPSGRNLGSEDFTGADRNELVDQAATWVKSTLDRQFPRNDEQIQVTAGVTLDRSGGNHKVHLEPADPLRADRLWMFAASGLKEDHPSLVDSGEATKEAIDRALAQSDGKLSKIVFHIERPGYDLRLIEVPITGPPKTVILNRLPEPALTVILDSIAGNEAVAERLRAKLRDLGLVVGTPDVHKAKREAYERSRGKNLSDGQRLTHLREARIDAFVTGSYEEQSE